MFTVAALARCIAPAVVAMASCHVAAAINPVCPQDHEQVVEQLNRVRAEGAMCGGRGAFGPAPAVVWNEQLAKMARTHAEWLVSIHDLVHRGPQGQTTGERARDAGYPYAKVGENLAHGQRTLEGALRAWAFSESHCATLFGAAYTEGAIICLPARDGRPMWVMELGRPKGWR